MSRILKRPMFRIGGSANEGIVSMAQPRKNYQAGTQYSEKAEELKKLFREAAGPGPSTYSDLGDLLISGGLNLMAGKGAGKGNLGAIAEAYRDPYATFAKARSTEDAFKRQLDLAAATQAVSSVEAENLARLKLKAENEEAIIKLKGDELKAVGAPPGLARVMTDYEKRTGEKVFPLPINPADPRGYTSKEVSQIPTGQTFVNNQGNFFKKLEDGKIVQVNSNTGAIIEPKPIVPEPGFFDKYSRKALIERQKKLFEKLTELDKRKANQQE